MIPSRSVIVCQLFSDLVMNQFGDEYLCQPYPLVVKMVATLGGGGEA